MLKEQRLSEVLTEDEIMELYNSQKKRMHQVANKYEKVARTSYSDWSREDLMSEMSVIFMENLHRYKVGSPASFFTYSYATYPNFIKRRMNRIKHGLVYPATVTNDLGVFMDDYLTLNQKDFLREVDKKVERGEITRYRADACVHNLLTTNSSLYRRVRTSDDSSNGAPLLETVAEGVEHSGVSNIFPKIPDFLFEFKKLPAPYVFWLTKLAEGYKVKDLKEVFKMRSSSFHKHHARLKTREILKRMEEGEEVDFAYEEERAYDLMMRSSDLSLKEIKDICSEVENENFFDSLYY